MGYLWAINPLTCPGCPRSAQCRSVPTWLADSLTSVHHLADGTRVVIRPLLPGDRALTEVDDQNHLALGAFTLDEPNHRGLGVARFVRLADRPTAAEAAVTVSASHQRRGLGTLLSAQLAGAAEERGIGTFVAHVLTDNAEWLSHLRQIGAEAFRAEPGVTRVEVSLATSGREQRIHRLLRHLADPPRS